MLMQQIFDRFLEIGSVTDLIRELETGGMTNRKVRSFWQETRHSCRVLSHAHKTETGQSGHLAESWGETSNSIFETLADWEYQLQSLNGSDEQKIGDNGALDNEELTP